MPHSASYRSSAPALPIDSAARPLESSRPIENTAAAANAVARVRTQRASSSSPARRAASELMAGSSAGQTSASLSYSPSSALAERARGRTRADSDEGEQRAASRSPSTSDAGDDDGTDDGLRTEFDADVEHALELERDGSGSSASGAGGGGGARSRSSGGNASSSPAVSAGGGNASSSPAVSGGGGNTAAAAGESKSLSSASAASTSSPSASSSTTAAGHLRRIFFGLFGLDHIAPNSARRAALDGDSEEETDATRGVVPRAKIVQVIAQQMHTTLGRSSNKEKCFGILFIISRTHKIFSHSFVNDLKMQLGLKSNALAAARAFVTGSMAGGAALFAAVERGNENNPDGERLRQLECVYAALERLALPCAAGLRYRMSEIGWHCLPAALFVQYVEHGILMLNDELILRLLATLDAHAHPDEDDRVQLDAAQSGAIDTASGAQNFPPGPPSSCALRRFLLTRMASKAQRNGYLRRRGHTDMDLLQYHLRSSAINTSLLVNPPESQQSFSSMESGATSVFLPLSLCLDAIALAAPSNTDSLAADDAGGAEHSSLAASIDMAVKASPGGVAASSAAAMATKTGVSTVDALTYVSTGAQQHYRALFFPSSESSDGED